MNNKLNIRFESCTTENYTNEINHDLRINNTPHIKNNNSNRLFIPNRNDLKKIKYHKINKGFDYRTEIFEKINELKIQHNTLYKKNQKRNLRKNNNTNSINKGIFSFPREFTPKKFNMDLKTFVDLGVKTIENICKELDIELIYVICHFDETTPHFHFMTSNFDSKGITIKRNREEGRKLQDLTEVFYKDFGLERGVPKEITGNRNYKKEIDKLKNQLKEEKNKNKEIKKENIKLQEENKELKNQNEELIKNILINQTEYNKLLTDVKSLKDEYIKYSEDVETKKEFYKSVLNPLLKNLQEIEKDYKLFNSKTLVQTLTDEQLKQRINKINNTFKSVKENIESPKFQTVKRQLEEYSGFSM